jgi:hypothetical protein
MQRLNNSQDPEQESESNSRVGALQCQEAFKANIEMQKRTQKIYMWLYGQLEFTNRAIAPILTAFRFRSIKPDFVPLYKSTQVSIVEVNH